MKKVVFIAPVLFSLNSFSQNVIVNNLGNQSSLQMQSVQVFASNKMVNDNNSNKPLRANANPQAYIQRASNANGNPRRQVRRVTVSNTNNLNPVQTNIINVSDNNINNDIQVLENFSQPSDNDLGNAFGNENIGEQIASANIPAIRVGTGTLNLNLDLNMPELKLPSVKLSSRKSVSGSKHKTFYVKNKLARLNRKMTCKLSLGRKLKIKVDSCFRW